MGKGFQGLEPEGGNLTGTGEGEGPHLLGQGFSFSKDGMLRSLSCLHGDWLATVFLLTVLTQGAWEKSIFYCSAGK